MLTGHAEAAQQGASTEVSWALRREGKRSKANALLAEVPVAFDAHVRSTDVTETIAVSWAGHLVARIELGWWASVWVRMGGRGGQSGHRTH